MDKNRSRLQELSQTSSYWNERPGDPAVDSRIDLSSGNSNSRIFSSTKKLTAAIVVSDAWEEATTKYHSVIMDFRDILTQGKEEGLPQLPDSTEGIISTSLQEQGIIASDKKLERSNIAFGNGITHLSALMIQTLIGKNDSVVLGQPDYGFILNDYVKQVGEERIEGLPLRVENNFHITPADLRKSLEEATKKAGPDGKVWIFFSNPNNPTGAVLSQNEIDELSKVVKEFNAYVIEDKAYLGSSTVKEGSFAASPGMYEKTVTLAGLSKGYAMPGMRAGMAIGPDELIVPLNKAIKETTCHMNINSQLALVLTHLEHARERYVQQGKDISPAQPGNSINDFLAQNAKRYEDNRAVLKDLIEGKDGIPELKFAGKPEGGFFQLVDVSSLIGKMDGDKELETAIDVGLFFRKHGVDVIPSELFGYPGEEKLVRVSVSEKTEHIIEGIKKIKTGIAGLNGKSKEAAVDVSATTEMTKLSEVFVNNENFPAPDLKRLCRMAGNSVNAGLNEQMAASVAGTNEDLKGLVSLLVNGASLDQLKQKHTDLKNRLQTEDGLIKTALSLEGTAGSMEHKLLTEQQTYLANINSSTTGLINSLEGKGNSFVINNIPTGTPVGQAYKFLELRKQTSDLGMKSKGDSAKVDAQAHVAGVDKPTQANTLH